MAPLVLHCGDRHFQFDRPASVQSVADLKNFLVDAGYFNASLPLDTVKLRHAHGPYLSDASIIPDIAFTQLTVSVSLMGGKGGFGANLRSRGMRMARRDESNISSCRDLHGRRIRTLENAKK